MGNVFLIVLSARVPLIAFIYILEIVRQENKCCTLLNVGSVFLYKNFTTNGSGKICAAVSSYTEAHGNSTKGK
jgi:hypothetical protein